MPTENEPDTPPVPDHPKAPETPATPSKDDVRAMIREELAAILKGADPEAADTPHPRTDKEMEEYVEGLVQKGMEALAAVGGEVPDPIPDPKVEPEVPPETKKKWQDILRTKLWD
jgi:hypothetical protein